MQGSKARLKERNGGVKIEIRNERKERHRVKAGWDPKS